MNSSYFNGRYHLFHIVNKSPWPFFLSLTLFSFVINTVALLHGHNVSHFLYITNFLLVAIIMGLWWRDVIREGFFEGCHTSVVMYGLRLGMALFIVSEVMFFVAFFWAFFHSSIAPTFQIGCVWPPVNYPVIDPFAIPFLNTIILVFSGLTLTLAHLVLLCDSLYYDKNFINFNLWKKSYIKFHIFPVNNSYHPFFNTFFFFIFTIILALLFTLFN